MNWKEGERFTLLLDEEVIAARVLQVTTHLWNEDIYADRSVGDGRLFLLAEREGSRTPSTFWIWADDPRVIRNCE